MKYLFYCTTIIFWFLLSTSCKSNSNKRSVNLEDLDKVIAAEPQITLLPEKSILTATEFIKISDCKSLLCVQMLMKERNKDFIHAKKGEFASFYRSTVIDTSGKSLVIPMSTLYVTVDAGADWRVAHTIHTKELSQQLLNEFIDEKFVLSDSVSNNQSSTFTYRYRSEQYPGLVLKYTKTFSPWRARGLYYTVTWPCYVFELKAG